jgi:hypothetical protein
MSNDQWTIFTCSPASVDPITGSALEVVDWSKRYTKIQSADLTKIWVISYSGFSWSNRPNVYLASLRWTADGNFVYVIPAFIMSGCVFYAPGYFLDGDTLCSLILNSGEFKTVLLFLDTGYAFSLSPNGQYLAYSIADEKKIIHVLGLVKGIDQQIYLGRRCGVDCLD